MNIGLFNREYWIRRFGDQVNINGYLSCGHSDQKISMHIHPLSSEQIQALPEGERGIKRLEGHGVVVLNTANTTINRKADLLRYKGEWYECVSSECWDHTALSHWNYQFIVLPKDTANTEDTANPPDEQVT